ncbi:MAG: 23S rRNA (adenine(2503)-C(2))-methyltransferase RlmN [Ignavibacteriales bacterium]|nr:MAG: 23S rRNA (adenine(2503)-C(2))-methyltransferase RlmN [Ignavibacteriales bacterium]
MENENNKKILLKGLSLDELRSLMIENKQPKYRGDQLFNWIYNRLVTNFDEMINFPKTLREELKDKCVINALNLVDIQYSKTTGTRKYLYSTADERKIESVIIPDDERATLCISTQVGCPLDCKLCATGLMGYKRNLTVGEIIDQYYLSSGNYDGGVITNIVYMGMGEPLLNYANTLKSLSIFTDELAKRVSRTRITISTAGIPQKIKELADSQVRVKLALSLHSCFEDVRSRIMPVNIKYPLKENIDALKYYTKKTKTRATFEYTMLKDVNDRQEDIDGLVTLCKKMPSKINIIPFNSIAHMSPDGISASLVPTSYDKILAFADALRQKNITVMVRETQGNDIAAACGQLAITKHNN